MSEQQAQPQGYRNRTRVLRGEMDEMVLSYDQQMIDHLRMVRQLNTQLISQIDQLEEILYSTSRDLATQAEVGKILTQRSNQLEAEKAELMKRIEMQQMQIEAGTIAQPGDVIDAAPSGISLPELQHPQSFTPVSQQEINEDFIQVDNENVQKDNN